MFQSLAAKNYHAPLEITYLYDAVLQLIGLLVVTRRVKDNILQLVGFK